jgi:CheY-like chemotaxis protein
MGGALTMSSELGRGSVFHLDVPVSPIDQEIVANTAVRRRVVGLRKGTVPPRVLVVDDEPHNRGWLKDLLSLVGFDVREAGSGEEAILVWQAWRPQVLLMDVRMPGMSGIDAARAIRADVRGSEPVIIALTASALGDERCACVESGMTDFLTKPCRETDLLERLQAHLGVDYVCAEDENAVADQGGTYGVLSPERAAALPGALTEAVLESVLSGDKDRLDLVTQEIEIRDAPMGKALKRLVDDFDYDALLDVFSRAASGTTDRSPS